MSIHDEINENAKNVALRSLVKGVKMYADMNNMSVCDVMKLIKNNINTVFNENKDCGKC